MNCFVRDRENTQIFVCAESVSSRLDHIAVLDQPSHVNSGINSIIVDTHTHRALDRLLTACEITSLRGVGSDAVVGTRML